MGPRLYTHRADRVGVPVLAVHPDAEGDDVTRPCGGGRPARAGTAPPLGLRGALEGDRRVRLVAEAHATLVENETGSGVSRRGLRLATPTEVAIERGSLLVEDALTTVRAPTPGRVIEDVRDRPPCVARGGAGAGRVLRAPLTRLIRLGDAT